MSDFEKALAAVKENNARAPYLSRWKHLKSGGEYVVGIHVLKEDDLTPMVVYYKRHDDPAVNWCRSASEFFDGRFQQTS